MAGSLNSAFELSRLSEPGSFVLSLDLHMSSISILYFQREWKTYASIVNEWTLGCGFEKTRGEGGSEVHWLVGRVGSVGGRQGKMDNGMRVEQSEVSSRSKVK